MRYAVARFNIYQRDMVYRIYVSDALRIITQNTAKPGDKFLKIAFSDFILNSEPQSKSPGEAKERICKKLREGE